MPENVTDLVASPDQPRAWISNITFSDDSALGFSRDDIVVVVGPNNAGKSAALRAIRDKLFDVAHASLVIKSLAVVKEGGQELLLRWLENIAVKRIDSSPSNPIFQGLGIGIHQSDAISNWATTTPTLGHLSRFFCHLLTADERLQGSNPATAIPIATEAPAHPIHYLQRDDSLEKKLSQQFRRAFGVELVVHRNAGSQVPLLVGNRPEPKIGQDRVSYEYILELEKLPRLQSQGDGMRSFVGVLLFTSVGRESILLIDEPEAFLHPPQARQLGRMLVLDKPTDRQLFLATHSGDILRGVLDSNSRNVRVVRIRRSGAVNIVRELDSSRIAALWSDPLLRYSNILDGLFHERVILGESDADARFFAAMTDAHFEALGPDVRRPDIMFTHCGGKSRLPIVIRALRELEVPVTSIADFDVLSAERPLRDIIEALGANWATFEADWRLVKNAIDSKRPELSTAEISREITDVLAEATDPVFPAEARKKIEKVLRRSSPWSTAKATGKSYVPSGDPTRACDRLLAGLRALGLFVVEVGELECFARSVGGHGPHWVNQVLRRDLRHDPELASARQFVAAIAAAEY